MILRIKVLLTGDGGVGKTSLIHRFVKGFFTESLGRTIGVKIHSKVVITDRATVELVIWDIAGQSLFRNLRRGYYKRAKGAFLVCDLTNPVSIENLHTHWISEIQEVTGVIPFVLLGNKVDLLDSSAVQDDDMEKLEKRHPTIIKKFKTSAKTGYNVEEAFLALVAKILSKSNSKEK